MKPIVIYTQPNCKKSEQAKKILCSRAVHFTEKDASEVEIKREMIERTGGRALTPQVFVNGQHLGSFEELTGFDKQGELKNLANNS